MACDGPASSPRAGWHSTLSCCHYGPVGIANCPTTLFQSWNTGLKQKFCICHSPTCVISYRRNSASILHTRISLVDEWSWDPSRPKKDAGRWWAAKKMKPFKARRICWINFKISWDGSIVMAFCLFMSLRSMRFTDQLELEYSIVKYSSVQLDQTHTSQFRKL